MQSRGEKDELTTENALAAAAHSLQKVIKVMKAEAATRPRMLVEVARGSLLLPSTQALLPATKSNIHYLVSAATERLLMP